MTNSQDGGAVNSWDAGGNVLISGNVIRDLNNASP